MKAALRHALIIAVFAPVVALADLGDGSGAKTEGPADPVLEKVVSANAQGDWRRSQEVLRDALAKDPANADYHNLYAYAMRKSPNPSLDLVFRHYHEALRINPKHRGAHEYLGEAYLMAGNLAKAKDHLAALDKLCFFGCDEYTLLKKAIAEYEGKRK